MNVLIVLHRRLHLGKLTNIRHRGIIVRHMINNCRFKCIRTTNHQSSSGHTIPLIDQANDGLLCLIIIPSINDVMHLVPEHRRDITQNLTIKEHAEQLITSLNTVRTLCHAKRVSSLRIDRTSVHHTGELVDRERIHLSKGFRGRILCTSNVVIDGIQILIEQLPDGIHLLRSHPLECGELVIKQLLNEIRSVILGTSILIQRIGVGSGNSTQTVKDSQCIVHISIIFGILTNHVEICIVTKGRSTSVHHTKERNGHIAIIVRCIRAKCIQLLIQIHPLLAILDMSKLKLDMQHITYHGSCISGRSSQLTIHINIVRIPISVSIRNRFLHFVLHQDNQVCHGCRRTTQVDRIHANVADFLIQDISNKIRAKPVLNRVGVTMELEILVLLSGIIQFQSIRHTNILNSRNQNIEIRNRGVGSRVLITDNRIINDTDNHVGKRIGITLV